MGGVLEKRRVKNQVFHAEERIYNLQISLSKLVSLSRSPLFSLSMQILAQHNFLCTMAHLAGQFSLSAIPYRVGIALNAPFAFRETTKVVIIKIPTVRLWKYVLERSRQNVKMIQRLKNPGLGFY